MGATANMEGETAATKCEVRPFKAEKCDGYAEGHILNIWETGPTTELLRPCHELKSLYNAESNIDENGTKLMEIISNKFVKMTVIFAVACINSRQNGTIHFGIADEEQREKQAGGRKPKEIVGLELTEQELGQLKVKLESEANSCFAENDKAWVAKCILPPVFIKVIPSGAAVPSRYVIEVDVNPESSVTAGKPLIGVKMGKADGGKWAPKEPLYFTRIMTSSKSLNKEEIARYSIQLPRLDQTRKEKEEQAMKLGGTVAMAEPIRDKEKRLAEKIMDGVDKRRVPVIKKTYFDETFADHLKMYDVIQDNKRKEIMAKLEHQRMGELLDHLPSRPPESQIRFVQCLLETDQKEAVVEQLHLTETEVRFIQSYKPE